MKLLLYCTKSNKKLFYDKVKQAFMYGLDGKNDKFNSVNGKIVADCDFEVEKITPNTWSAETECRILKGSCLKEHQLFDYIIKGDENENQNPFYAINIKNLHIFNELHRLDDYFILNENPHILEKAPQNMCRVSQRFGGLHTEDTPMQDYILISIRPEWLCKILNGEKTIEIRKKVLKEMLNDK